MEDSPSSKKTRLDGRFPLTRWELAVAMAVFSVFVIGLFFIFMKMPAAEYGKIKLPRTISDLRLLNYPCIVIYAVYELKCLQHDTSNMINMGDDAELYITKDNLAIYANDHPAQFILGYCSVYIFMQTFMIPGTIFMSLLAGALFGVFRGLLLVVFNATAGASCCYFLSKLIGRPIVNWLWPEKLRFFQGEIAKRREKLMNYMLFLRVTPTLPNLFINLASPIVDIPFHVFFLATIVGLIPASFITVRAGLALGELKSVKDLYDFKTLAVLFLIGSVIICPAILKRKRTYE